MVKTSTIEEPKRKVRLWDWFRNKSLAISIILLSLTTICLIVFVIWISTSNELSLEDAKGKVKLFGLFLTILVTFSTLFMLIKNRQMSSNMYALKGDCLAELISRNEHVLLRNRYTLEEIMKKHDEELARNRVVLSELMKEQESELIKYREEQKSILYQLKKQEDELAKYRKVQEEMMSNLSTIESSFKKSSYVSGYQEERFSEDYLNKKDFQVLLADDNIISKADLYL